MLENNFFPLRVKKNQTPWSRSGCQPRTITGVKSESQIAGCLSRPHISLHREEM